MTDCNCDCHTTSGPTFSAAETRRHAALQMALDVWGQANIRLASVDDAITSATKIEAYLRGDETAKEA